MSNRALLCLFVCGTGLYGATADSIPNNERTPAFPANITSENQLLDKAREANGGLYSTLKSFICREEIQRYKGDTEGSKVRTIDRVSANLSFENGTERYSEIFQNKRSRSSLSALTGAWSEGEFGTLLQQTGKLLEIQPVTFVDFAILDGKATAIYNFSISEGESPWDLEVATKHYRIPFTTEVWISAGTGEILKIARRSLAIPVETGISKIDWQVTLGTVDLNGQAWLLPAAAEYSVSYTEAKRREWNQMSFSNYKRYGSESVLKFNGF